MAFIRQPAKKPVNAINEKLGSSEIINHELFHLWYTFLKQKAIYFVPKLANMWRFLTNIS